MRHRKIRLTITINLSTGEVVVEIDEPPAVQ